MKAKTQTGNSNNLEKKEKEKKKYHTIENTCGHSEARQSLVDLVSCVVEQSVGSCVP